MKLKPSVLVVVLATAVCSGAGAEELCSFSGSLDLDAQTLKVVIGQEGHRLTMDVSRQDNESLALVADFQHFPTPLFDMTTQLKGVVRLESSMFSPTAVSGRIWQDGPGGQRFDDDAFEMEFLVTDGVVRVRRLVCGGMSATASVSLLAPYATDARFAFEDMDIAYITGWLKEGARGIDARGTFSGDLLVSGTPGRLAVKSNILSQNGSIEKLSYELFSLHLQGIYPRIELSRSTITKSGGLTFDLEGTVDLSNRSNMKTQFKAIQKIPLVKEDALQSQWVFKRVQDPDGEGKTETKFFLKKDKSTSSTALDDSEMFGVEKKIGF